MQAWLPDFLYNNACEEARSGRSSKAISLLELAIDKGYSDFKHLRADADLGSLVADEAFIELIKCKDPSLKDG